MPRRRGTWPGLARAARLLPHLGWGALLALAVACGLYRWPPERLMQRWMRGLLRILDLHVVQHGATTAAPALLVANHISWLDIAVLGSRQPLRFIAKHDLRDWPLIGWLARLAGTYFIRRGAGGTRALTARIQIRLEAGGSVALFPEGTTSDGRGVGHFHARLFAAAIDAGVMVQPVALRYSGSTGSRLAPFIDDDRFVPHLWRILRSGALRVHVHYLPPVAAIGPRDELAGRCRQLIRTQVLAGPGLALPGAGVDEGGSSALHWRAPPPATGNPR